MTQKNKRLLALSEIPRSRRVAGGGKPVSLEVYEGDFILLRGANGTGKTYLLNLMAGLVLPFAGEVVLGTKNLAGMTDSERLAWRRNIGLIPTHTELFPNYTTLENIQVAAQLAGIDSEEALDFSQESAELCGLKDVMNRSVNTLSRGQRKRVVIARALVGRPNLILADNPLEALDSSSQEQFLYLCSKLAQLGYAVVMTLSSNLPFDIKAAISVNLGEEAL
ncbi:MAG: ATP-binding cassette domain-containing protein [Burkholderiales bacterium]|nr:ATP-binding cassette domain-containing protein [Burkholderiales bacterium]